MKSLKKHILITLLFILFGCDSSSNENDQIVRLAGSDITRGLNLTYKVDEWISPLGDGKSIRIYEMVRNDSSYLNYCNAANSLLKKGYFKDMPLRIIELEKYIDKNKELCYSVESVQGVERVLIIQNYIIYYWAIR